MATLFGLIVSLGTCLTLAYSRIDLKISTAVVGILAIAYTTVGSSIFCMIILWLLFAGMAALNIETLRREHLTLPLLNIYRTMSPSLSQTERDALEAGNVWWEGELFSGMPDWSKLTDLPTPKLTDEEKAFLDGPTEDLCRLLDTWDIPHRRLDLSEEVWAFIKKKRFFAMIIPKKYGGLGFSPLAISVVIAKISSHDGEASSTVAVPNSLGPAELLLHYGTEEQKQHWLPRLALAEEIPCFALTSPHAGSDATAIVDSGIVCKGTYNGKQITGVRLNWDKRYITLAPIATVLGLAFKLYDPDHLLGDRDKYGITAALIPTDLPGITIGRRHLPIGNPFQNGPTQGKDVFVPLDSIIGGPKMAGQGWRMLVELLSVGRGVVLPATALGGAKASVFATGAYAQLRHQFNHPIGKFEGVGEALARMAGYTYTMAAASRVTCSALNVGEKPAVPTAILKYHNTEFGRHVTNDAMDVHGGRGIMLGPSNYLARRYESLPVGITVEGANILTRSLIIFGQGAIRCHPFVLAELEAARNVDPERGLIDFDQLLFKHIGYTISNAVRSLVMGLTLSRFSKVSARGWIARYYQRVNRYSASFALTTDIAMLVLGGELKRKELLSARLGDVLSYLYLVSMILKHYEDQGAPEADRPLVEWSCRMLLYRTQEQFHSFLRNFPNRWIAATLRLLIFPRGRTFSSPSDELGQEVVDLIINPTPSRERLCADIYKSNALGRLQEALELAEEVKPLERKVFDAKRRGEITADDTHGQIEEAQKKNIITATEAKQITVFSEQVMALIAVDDFTPEELLQHTATEDKRASTKRPAKN